ncbi:unnamed protein product [Parnassius mnemosyne]|uniref:DUF4817 domain-containing protein n=1 Tax=Parnassius mnemosyne TaxID=213953 RepID=A0AAV1MBZ2_9NEOP
MHFYSAAEYTDMVLLYGEYCQNSALTPRTYRERCGATRVCPISLRTIKGAVQRIRENQRIVPNTDEGVAPRHHPPSFEQRVLDHFDRNPICSLDNLNSLVSKFLFCCTLSNESKAVPTITLPAANRHAARVQRCHSSKGSRYVV